MAANLACSSADGLVASLLGDLPQDSAVAASSSSSLATPHGASASSPAVDPATGPAAAPPVQQAAVSMTIDDDQDMFGEEFTAEQLAAQPTVQPAAVASSNSGGGPPLDADLGASPMEGMEAEGASLPMVGPGGTAANAAGSSGIPPQQAAACPPASAASLPSTSPEAEEGDAALQGFELDPDSGMYYNSALGFYFDPASHLWRDAASGAWYKMEGGQYVAV